MNSLDLDSRQSSVVPESSPPSSSKFHPYTTPNHRVTKGRYITSTDPRGYVPVYEYPLNNQWIMMDVDDGYVLWTGIWKALGNSKADIVKMVEAQPELASQLRRVRGGYLKIQGTWVPYEVAMRLARRVAWPIRHDLIPLFGPTFPDTCLAPDQPGYGQVVVNQGRRGKRSKYQITSSTGVSPLTNVTPEYDDFGNGHPYSPVSSASQYENPSLAAYDYPPGAFYPPFSHHNYQAMPSSHPGPYPQSTFHQHRGDPYAASEDSMSAGGVSRNPSVSSNSASRHRYAPYPQSSPGSSSGVPRQDTFPTGFHPQSHPPSPPSSTNSQSFPQRDLRYDLPPIHSIEVPRPAQSQQGYALPPITSLREGDKPEMDASAVLRRLRLDDSEGAGREPAYPPGRPTFHGDASYSSQREGEARWAGISPPDAYTQPPVSATRGGHRAW